MLDIPNIQHLFVHCFVIKNSFGRSQTKWILGPFATSPFKTQFMPTQIANNFRVSSVLFILQSSRMLLHHFNWKWALDCIYSGPIRKGTKGNGISSKRDVKCGKKKMGKGKKGHDTISARSIKIQMKINDSRTTKKSRIGNWKHTIRVRFDKILINFY